MIPAPKRGGEVVNVIEHPATDHTKDPANKKARKQFHSIVLNWSYSSGRDFPWRVTSNPFHILVAEVLLRQTQADRVVEPYFELVEQYPTAGAFAQADPGELNEWFRPLGPVRRADRLIEASKRIVEQHGGCVPTDLDALMSLPGIGTYSARAVLCLAFRIPVPMVDGSSGRLFHRAGCLVARGWSRRHQDRVADVGDDHISFYHGRPMAAIHLYLEQDVLSGELRQLKRDLVSAR